jgi:hypothetical protein
LRFPDGHDTEILAADAPIDVDALVALAQRRRVVLDRLRTMLGRAGWGICPGASHWAIGHDVMSSSIDVGWTLTERLRDSDVDTAFVAIVAPWQPLLEPDDAADPAADTDALWQAHRRALARAYGEDPDAPPDVEDEPEPEAHVPRSRATLGRERREAAMAAAGALSDADMDRWADATLAVLRRDFAQRHALASFLDPHWRTGDDDWLDDAAYAAACREAIKTDNWHTAALCGLFKLHAPDAMELALAAWDDWEAQGGFDHDSFGFDDLAAFVHRERPAARDLLFADDDVRQSGRAFRGGFANALHSVRCAVAGSLDEWERGATPRARRMAFFDAIETLQDAGRDAAPAVLGADEDARLRAAAVDYVRDLDNDSDEGIYLEWVLAVALHCGWTEVAQAPLDADRDAVLLGRYDNYHWETPHLALGLLAVSAFAPGPECAQLARLAQVRIRERRTHGPLTDTDAIAIAWWRCRRAMR